MSIKFKKLIVGDRFSNTFENWSINNEIIFSNEGFINIYASNGVGKSSFSKALKNKLSAQYEYEYNGITYTEKSKETPIMIIDDFFFRNIAKRDNEKLSDYILGSQITKELELKNKIQIAKENIKSQLIVHLKDIYGIKAKNSNLCSLSSDETLKKFISALANNRDKAKDYDENKILELLNILKVSAEITCDINKYEYVRKNLEQTNSIIKSIIEFDVSNIKTINGFSKLDIDNDALKILRKHKKLNKCIFEESHKLPENIENILEENKNKIIIQLNDSQKDFISKIFDLNEEEPFNLKDIFNLAFEVGETSEIEELILEIKTIVLKIENEIRKDIIKIINSSKLKELYDEYIDIINKKVELSDEDEILIKEIIENCINKKVIIERDKSKNLIFKIDKNDFIGKTRQELPLSTGEQNFISLYFELLAAKNCNKDIVIIDDPVSSFDSIYKNKIIYAILKVLAEKKVIVLTHNIDTIKLMQYQHKDCFNLYLLNNENEGNNGFIKLERKHDTSESPKDIDMMLEVKNVIENFKNIDFVREIKDKKQFLISLIPFMRSYCNLLIEDNGNYKKLCKMMHGYESEKININNVYIEIFKVDVLNGDYNINIDDILSIVISEEIIDSQKYPLLNRTLIHTLNYLQLRLIVENTLYNTDKSKLRLDRNPKLHQIIEVYLRNNNKLKSKLLSKKTLLNEMNHFEFNMCIFMPTLDISDSKLKEERESIINICEEIKKTGT